MSTLVTVLLIAAAGYVLWRVFAGSAARNASRPPAATARDALQHSRADEPSTWAPTHPGADARDNWEGSFWEVQAQLPAKAALQFSYTDGEGRHTRRQVDVRQFGALETTTLLIGHCHLRDATRTFRADRMRDCVDLASGEVIADVGAFLRARYEASPERLAKRLRDEEYDLLRVLLYVGKADGQLRAAERAIIRAAAIGLAQDTRVTDEVVDELLAGLQTPTLHAFKLAVGRLADRGADVRQVVIESAEKMVATQKTVHRAEQEALDYMRGRFAKVAEIASRNG